MKLNLDEQQIKKMIQHGDLKIILFDWENSDPGNENVKAFDDKGNERWQIPKMPHPYERSFYTEIRIEKSELMCFNWDGSIVKLDPLSGEIIGKNWYK